MQYENFVTNLVKGRIVETIFKSMLAETDRYTVIPAGYEHTMPMLAQHHKRNPHSKSLETMRKSPDFILVSNTDDRTLFVEVKYRKSHFIHEMIETSKSIIENWDDAYLFLATQDGFYFDSCKNIIDNAYIMKLNEALIPLDKQNEYLDILRQFIRP